MDKLLRAIEAEDIATVEERVAALLADAERGVYPPGHNEDVIPLLRNIKKSVEQERQKRQLIEDIVNHRG